jgi:hypothetical protein
MTRAAKAAAKSAKPETVNTADLAAAEVIAAVTDGGEVTVTAADEPAAEKAEPEVPAIPEYRFNVTGEQRKALVAAISEYTGEASIYKAAPTFAYVIGAYTVDKTGTLTGEPNPELLTALEEQGFHPDDSTAE